MNLQSFFDNFNLITDAPNGSGKLRELILQLAVEGKLVSQDPTDEPAAKLLQKIQASQERLAKIPSINEEKVRPIRKQEKPFILPDNWEWVRLSQITNAVHYGYTASANHTLTEVRLLRITDIQNGNVDWSTVPGCEIDEKKLAGVKLANNDILIARTGGTIGKSFIVQNLPFTAVFASYLIRAVPNENIYARYLKLFLDSRFYWSQLYERSMGTGQPNVNATSLKSLVVPLPPLKEQQRIVAGVDDLTKYCDALKTKKQARRKSRVRLNNATLKPLNNASALTPHALRKATDRLADNFSALYDSAETVSKLRTTILELAVQGKLVPQNSNDEPAHLFVKRVKKEKESLSQRRAINDDERVRASPDQLPYLIPTSWQWVRLSEISDVGTGSTPLSSNSEYYDEGDIAWVTSAATGEPFIFDVQTRITPKAVHDYRLRIYPAGTLIVALYGQGKTRGQVSQLKIDATINQACAAVCLIESSNEHSRYIAVFFKKAYEELRALAAGGAQPNLNVRKIKETFIPLPPLEEQKRIVLKVGELSALCDDLEMKLRRAEASSEKLMSAAVQHVLSSTVGTRPHDKLSLRP